MFEKNSKTKGRLGLSVVSRFVFLIAVLVFLWNPALNKVKSFFAPRPHLVVLNIIGAAFDQLDFDKTFDSAPECRGLKFARGSEPPDEATYIAGMVLFDVLKSPGNGVTFE